MKKIFKFLVWLWFKIQLKIIFFIKKPVVILVVWWGEKSLIREKLVRIFSRKQVDVKTKYRPYNTWFGVALNALDLPSAYSSRLGWVWIYLLSKIKFLKHLISYPKYLILEWGIDEIWEAKKFVSLLNPHVIVFSSIQHQFIDDFDKIKVIEKEFDYLISWLNNKSKKLWKFEKQWSLEEMVDLILNWEYYLGAINKKYEILNNLSWKLIRKFYFVE